ncbi:hypothetical protein ACLKA7_003689 [Drosophila subpalustris]
MHWPVSLSLWPERHFLLLLLANFIIVLNVVEWQMVRATSAEAAAASEMLLIVYGPSSSQEQFLERPLM